MITCSPSSSLTSTLSDWKAFDSTASLPATPGSSIVDLDVESQTFSSGHHSADFTPRKIAVLGVGYVGLHLVQEFGRRHRVLGFDISPRRISDITEQFKALPLVNLTCEEEHLEGQDFYLISVPTLLDGINVNTSYLEDALALVDRYAQPGATVVIESSVAVGMTRKLLGPILRTRGLQGGMSPEVSTSSSIDVVNTESCT